MLGIRIIFMGTPTFALPTLRALLASSHEVCLVVSQPERPAGRGKNRSQPPVIRLAIEQRLATFQPGSLRQPEAVACLAECKPDLILVAAYGLLLPSEVLDLPRLQCLNLHPSLLPRHRGASPIPAAILAGDDVTGVTVMVVSDRMDAGPIVGQREWRIRPEDDAVSLSQRLAELGAELVMEALDPWADGRLAAEPQDETRATSCGRIQVEAARLEWSNDATQLWREVRAYRGWPDAHTTWEGRLLKVLSAEPVEVRRQEPAGTVIPWQPSVGGATYPAVVTSAGLLLLRAVLLEGRRAMSGAEFLRGYPRLVGGRLG